MMNLTHRSDKLREEGINDESFSKYSTRKEKLSTGGAKKQRLKTIGCS